MYYGPPRMAPDQIFVDPGWSGAVLGVFFLLPTVEICRRLLLLPAALRIAPAQSRNNYGWGRRHHKITTVLLRIVMDRHGSTTNRPGPYPQHYGCATNHPRTVPAALCTAPLALRTVSVICEPSQITTDCPGQCRCRYGWCRYCCGFVLDDAGTVPNRPEPTTDCPGSWPRPGSSWTIPDFLNSLKFQKRPPGLSRTVQDLPGPPRTTQNHHGSATDTWRI